MGHTIKNQDPRKYRPSATRRASGLESVKESRENALKRWNKVRQQIKSMVRLERNIRAKGVATRGRFRVSNSTPPKRTNSPKVTHHNNSKPGIYFVGWPKKIGRFTVINNYGFVPMPKKRTNAKSP